VTAAAAARRPLPEFPFTRRSAFHADLRREVARHFALTGRSSHGDVRMWLKTAVMLAWAAGSYLLLLLADVPAWQRVLLAGSLGLAMAGIGFSVMHDANHEGYARGRRTNRILGFTIDLVGGSSYFWRHKHNILHHTYTNVSGLDLDIGGNAWLRFSPDKPRRPVMRYQHLYVWALFAVYPLGWWLWDDFKRFATLRTGDHVIPRPGPGDRAAFLAGKLFFFGWTVVLPVAVHRSWLVLPLMAITVATLGLTLATTFQLAHCVGEADFHVVRSEAPGPDWATHQVTTTVDFARGNWLLSWYMGGLNFQVVHHLFPKVCHVHYPDLAPIVEATCARHGVRYTAQPTFGAALAANVRWLRALGRA
jgi:linoleoyl-CoA desaturase